MCFRSRGRLKCFQELMMVFIGGPRSFLVLVLCRGPDNSDDSSFSSLAHSE